MRSVLSYLLLMFMVMFWIFRIVVAFTDTMGIDFAFKPISINAEIILLFLVIPCVLLVGKRKLIGSILYLIIYGAYFGVDLYNIVMSVMDGGIIDTARSMAAFIGVVLPIAVFFNLLIDKNRTANPVDKKTDWFYKNEEFDRKIDERADRNEYRNY